MNTIKECLEELKKSETIQNLYQEYKINISEIDLVPICFGKLDVSARTDHGIITINEEFKNNKNEILKYLSHELVHNLQQTTGNKPTSGSTEETYLDNPAEIEGFQTQTEFISEIEGDEAAEEYLDELLDFHEVKDPKEIKKRKKELLQLASQIILNKIV